MNIELLQQVRDSIAKEPLFFDMRFYQRKLMGRQEPVNLYIKGTPEEIRYSAVKKKNIYGISSCICGRGIAIANPELFNKLPGYWDANWIKEGADVFGLTIKQAQQLFITALWPNPWAELFIGVADYQDEARIAISFLDFIIQGKGDILCKNFDILSIFSEDETKNV